MEQIYNHNGHQIKVIFEPSVQMIGIEPVGSSKSICFYYPEEVKEFTEMVGDDISNDFLNKIQNG